MQSPLLRSKNSLYIHSATLRLYRPFSFLFFDHNNSHRTLFFGLYCCTFMFRCHFGISFCQAVFIKSEHLRTCCDTRSAGDTSVYNLCFHETSLLVKSLQQYVSFSANYSCSYLITVPVFPLSASSNLSNDVISVLLPSLFSRNSTAALNFGYMLYFPKCPSSMYSFA